MKRALQTWPAAPVLALALLGCLSDDPESQAVDNDEASDTLVVEEEAMAEELLTRYRSPSEQFETSHPVTWITEETFDGGAVILANTQEAMDRHRAGTRPDDGDLVVNVGFLPATLFEQRELRRFEVTVDLAPDDFLRAVLPIFQPSDTTTMGTVELVTLDDQHQAGAVTVQAPDREGRILTFPAGPRVAAMISTTTAPGQGERYDEVVDAIAAATTFDGDGDALYGRLLTG
jgi:hypothetical protein